ncbi:MAG: hypothetical protein HYY37_06190 [Candidatus Aenigmarchaeota archaeon]|nr:hypothetical protein [Candidatus Aenigmarchaeota archaeon]
MNRPIYRRYGKNFPDSERYAALERDFLYRVSHRCARKIELPQMPCIVASPFDIQKNERTLRERKKIVELVIAEIVQEMPELAPVAEDYRFKSCL